MTPLSLDVLVLGEHPCASLAAAMLLDKPSFKVAQALIPGQKSLDRLVFVNPRVFQLHKSLAKAKKKIAMTPVFGVSFVGDDGVARSEHRAKSAAGYVAAYDLLRKHFIQAARDAGVSLFSPKALDIIRVDEKGFEIRLDQQVVRPKAILLAGNLSPEQGKLLGLPDPFARETMRRYSFVRLEEKWVVSAAKPLMAMSLDLNGKLTWAWMLIGDGRVQLAVEQMLNDAATPMETLSFWARVLEKHGLLKQGAPIRELTVETLELPAAGALANEIVANRTLLFGPAGGFYSAGLEDIYPNCWSAEFAVDAMRKALKEPHLQDALQPYRQSWGATLGEYLRGPQQNLRFLLPLVYRNPVMTARMAESILQGKSVVR